MEISRCEIFRYLGYGAEEPEERIREQIEDCIAELLRVSSPRRSLRSVPLVFLSETRMDFQGFQVESADLAAHVKGCGEAVLFAASLGTGPDFLLQRYSRLNMSRAVLLQAAAAAMIEAYCEEEQEALKKRAEACGKTIRPRFSPGYGDFSLTYQTDLCRALAAEKTVGITLTDSLLMLPTKSVTAVIGVGAGLQQEEGGRQGACARCQKTDCLYRRG